MPNLKNEVTVLIVDDQAGIRCLMAEFLKSRYANVLTAKNGRETLRIFQRHSVDLLLLDVNMPGMDGFTTLSSLRKQGYHCPVILMTGLGEHLELEEKIRELKVSGVLTKPFDLDELQLLIISSLASAKEE